MSIVPRLSHAWQSWKSARAVALLAVIALAVGIGSTTAIFSIVNAVLLNRIPYEHGERFVSLYAAQLSKPSDHSGVNYPDLLEYQSRLRSLDLFGWFPYAADPVNMMFRGHPENVRAQAVTPWLLEGLGVRPSLGRWFGHPAPDSGGYRVAVISHGLWRRLGADPSIIGKPLILGNRQFLVSGVAPPSFRFPLVGIHRTSEQNDLWVPLDPHEEAANPHSGLYIACGRLRPGVTLASAEAEARRIAAEIAKHDPANHPSYTAHLESLRESAVSSVRPALLMLFAAAGLLFLITCANVAGLLLARSIGRARETAVRIALGATRVQLAQQYFLEGLLLSLAGAAVGLLLSMALLRLVLTIAGEYDPFLGQTPFNLRVYFFVFAAGWLSSALFSLAPLWQALNTTPNSVLSDGVRTSAGKSARRLSQSLVVAEIALAFTLLGVSALLLTELANLYRVRPGFDSDNLLTFQLRADPSQYPNTPKLASYQRALRQAIEAIPGVSGAAFTNQLPLAECCYQARISPDGFNPDARTVSNINISSISDNYFSVMRIPLHEGRFLTERDNDEKSARAVIDQAAASRYWPGRDPIGTYGRFLPDGSRFQVVGVVGDVRNKALSEFAVPDIYLINTLFAANRTNFLVRSPVPPNTLLPEIRQAILNVNRAQPIYDVRPMSTVVQTSLALQRLSSLIMTLFAAIAVLMAALGIYGVVSYSVRQRTVEIGTRLALGAQNGDLFRLVLGEGFRMAAYGVALGALAIAAATWLLKNVLQMVKEIDAASFVYSLVLIAAIAFAASFFPAWRATLLSPMVAIRDESLSLWQSAGRGIRQFFSGATASVTRTSEAYAVANATLLSDFIHATRRAASFDEAIGLALGTLCDKIGAASAMLLENISGTEYECLAAKPVDATPCRPLPAPGFLSNRLRFYSLPLPITSGDLDTWLHWASENKPQHVPEIEALRAATVRVALPLRTQTDMLGLLLLGPPLAGSGYTAFELRLLRNCAEQFALMMENARLTGRVVEQEKLRRDVALAAEVQRRLLPERSPDSPFASLAAISLPARTVGGDYYDFLEIGDHRIGIALADIAGKGVAAALIMSVVQASLRIISSEEGVSLPQLAARMNRYLYRSTGANGYATFFYAQVDEQSHQLSYVNAGHNPPYLLRSAASNGSSPTSSYVTDIEELSTGGIVIGMFPHARYEEAAVPLQSGDVLVAFTDGVTEALNPGEEEFGEERLKSLLRQVVHLPVQEMSARISRELKSWIADADQHDDLTFIVMKVN